MVEPAFQSDAVEDRFAAYAEPMRDRLLALRALIFETAAATDGVGAIEETLKPVATVMRWATTTMISAPPKPTLPTTFPSERYMTTPRMVRIDGVNTPPNVPKRRVSAESGGELCTSLESLIGSTFDQSLHGLQVWCTDARNRLAPCCELKMQCSS